MQYKIWHQYGIQNYNGNVLSVYSVGKTGEMWPQMCPLIDGDNATIVF